MSSIIRTATVRTVLGVALATSLVASIGLAQPSRAAAAPRKARTIARHTVIERARKWVAHRVPYSQSRYHNGYRQDCSGFVSMAWQLGASYTTRSLPSVARRISISKLRPGDAVLAPGHTTIFGGWKNRAKRQYYAYEEPTWGKHAIRRVRVIPSGAKLLRRPGIRDHRKTRPRPKRTPITVVISPVVSTVKVGAKPAPSAPSVAIAGLTPSL